MAGSKNQLCKHRIAVLEGNSSATAAMDTSKLDTFLSWVSSSTLPSRMAALTEAETEVVRAKKRVATLKGELGRRMDVGL